MKIKFVKRYVNYLAEQEVEMQEKNASKLVRLGYAIEVKGSFKSEEPKGESKDELTEAPKAKKKK